MKYIIRLTALLSLIFLASCTNTNQALKEDYFIGTWQSDDSAKIVLENKGKGRLFNFNYKKVNSLVKDSILNGDCDWNLKRVNGDIQIIITYYDGRTIHYLNKIVRTKLEASFQIESTGIWSQSSPRSFYILIGDPDDFNKYSFTKKE